MRYLVVILGMFFALFLSCEKDKVTQKPSFVCEDTISFSTQVFPIFEQNCTTTDCHDSGTAEGGYAFVNYENISADAENALAAMQHNPNFEPMPDGEDKLADSTIQVFECWIEQGKLDN